MQELQRPGGELATRPIHFFWVVDCSGSMYGEKIGIVNNTIQECIPEMRNSADNNPNAQLLIRALQFSSGASWITTSPVPVETYSWEDMEANGLTELGKAFDLLAAQLSIPPMPARALPPVIVLLSDGQPTDDYKKSLDKLKGMPWFRKAVKIAISIGQDADDDVLIEFTGNKELVLQANNATALAKMIKWASTTASMVSAPSSKPMNSTPVSAPAASTPSAAASVPADDPFAPANNGAPLVLDMSNIPNPDDFDEGAVW
ncbi:vWA domain-containing protein [Bariatricus sp. HCP28S3_A7]|uniref:vWA domain-containing protein n=1 Tax=Bariatricus sp. HCP28S3_A7 TaxID=3438894 RepID=UPI003F8C6699